MYVCKYRIKRSALIRKEQEIMFMAGGFFQFYVLAPGLLLLILCHGIWYISACPPEDVTDLWPSSSKRSASQFLNPGGCKPGNW